MNTKDKKRIYSVYEGIVAAARKMNASDNEMLIVSKSILFHCMKAEKDPIRRTRLKALLLKNIMEEILP